MILQNVHFLSLIVMQTAESCDYEFCLLTVESSGSTLLTVQGKHIMEIARERLRIASNSLLTLAYKLLQT